MISFNINPSSGVPIYKQVYEQLERLIVNKQLSADEFVPSVRQLALELEVNPMTISKAYSLLEERGLLVRQRGKGMQVARRNQAQTQADTLDIVRNNAKAMILEARQMGLSTAEIAQLFNDELSKKGHQ